MFSYISHFLFPMIIQRIDADNYGGDFLGNEFGIALVELRLYEDDTHHFALALVNDRLQLCRRWLFAVCFDGDLPQAIVACKVGKGRMIDQESAVRIGSRKKGAQVAVQFVQLSAQAVGAVSELSLMAWGETAEAGADVADDDACVYDRHP